MKGCPLSFLFLAVVLVPLGVNAQDKGSMELNRAQAKIKAFDLATRFGDLSQLKDTQGNNLEGEFLDLFGLNAQLLLDFYANEESAADHGRSLGPKAYCAEYYSKKIDEPLGVVTKVMKPLTSVLLSGAEDHFIVRLVVKRTFPRVLSNGVLIEPEKPKEVFQFITVRVSKQEQAFIQIIQPYFEQIENKWTLDFYRFGGGDGTIRSNGAAILTKDPNMAIALLGFRVGYRFYPFKEASPLLRGRLGFHVGAGAETWNYKLTGIEAMGSQQVDYLGAGDNVIDLIDLDMLNDLGGDDFILNQRSKFAPETIKRTLFTIRGAGSYDVFKKSKWSTNLELGLGYVSGGKANVHLSAVDDQFVVFQEGPFAGNEVTIEHNSVGYNGDIVFRNTHANAYGFGSSTSELDQQVELRSTIYWDVKLTQVFNYRKIEFGVFLSLRHHITPSLDNTDLSTIQLNEIRQQEVSASRAFVEKATPHFFGFGLSIQKIR
ncbi:MAG: hypothetical protein KA408_05525 [Flavobacteriales bacterium]|nr:hypothetical protein [Flavobacteriales bacterium]